MSTAAAPALPSADLDLLRVPGTHTGYHGVYRRDPRARTVGYYAEPVKGLKLPGAHRHPRAAAAAVAGWWRNRYGPGWRMAFAARHGPGWAAVAVPLGPRPAGAFGFDLDARTWVDTPRPGGRYARTADAAPAVWRLAPPWRWAAVRRPGMVGYAAVAVFAPVGRQVVGPAADRGGLFAAPADCGAAVRAWAAGEAGVFYPLLLIPPRRGWSPVPRSDGTMRAWPPPSKPPSAPPPSRPAPSPTFPGW